MRITLRIYMRSTAGLSLILLAGCGQPTPEAPAVEAPAPQPAQVALPPAQAAPSPDAVPAGPYQATGIKIGEITPSEAIVWTRLTRLVEPVSADAPGLEEFSFDILSTSRLLLRCSS